MRTYEEVRQAVLKKNYLFFESGNYNINLIFERTNDLITNYFTDFLHLCYKDDNGQPKILSISATTKPGINNCETFMLKPNQYRGSHYFTEGIANAQYPFSCPHFRQRLPLQCFPVKNNIVNKEIIIQDSAMHTHIHCMTKQDNQRIGNPIFTWSEECMGAEAVNFNKILPVIREAVKVYGINFTITILETIDFE